MQSIGRNEAVMIPSDSLNQMCLSVWGPVLCVCVFCFFCECGYMCETLCCIVLESTMQDACEKAPSTSRWDLFVCFSGCILHYKDNYSEKV